MTKCPSSHLTAIGEATSQGTPWDGVIPLQASYAGLTYAEWSVEWWRWIIGIPAAEGPFGEGYACAGGANDAKSPVWFLVSFFGATPVEVECTVPVGKALFFPIYNTECSTVEGSPDDDLFFLDLESNEPEACVEKFFDNSFRRVEEPQVTVERFINGEYRRYMLSNLEDYRFQSAIFDFALPAEGENFLGVDPDACSDTPFGCQAIAEGYWIMLPPLAKGQYRITIYAKLLRAGETEPFRYVNTQYMLRVTDRSNRS